MPNTRADLERLRHHWEHDHGAWEPEHGDEMIALCERLLEQRDDFAVALTMLKERIEALAARSQRFADFHGIMAAAAPHQLCALLNPGRSNEDG